MLEEDTIFLNNNASSRHEKQGASRVDTQRGVGTS
jgi:hypothetical protein